MKTGITIILIVISISCHNINTEDIRGVYTFDIKEYLSQSNCINNMELMGLGGVNIEELSDIENWEDYNFYINIINSKNDLIIKVINFLRVQYLEMVYTELTINDNFIIIKQYNTDLNSVLVSVMRYNVINHKNNMFDLCIYNKKDELIGLRKVVLNGRGVILYNDNNCFYFKRMEGY